MSFFLELTLFFLVCNMFYKIPVTLVYVYRNADRGIIFDDWAHVD
jgi:hypothetical protein